MFSSFRPLHHRSGLGVHKELEVVDLGLRV